VALLEFPAEFLGVAVLDVALVGFSVSCRLFVSIRADCPKL